MKQSENKIAQISLMKTLIVTVLVLLIGIAIIANISKSADIETSIATCRTSIVIKDNTDIKVGSWKVLEPSSNICKTHQIEIPETKGVRIYDETEYGVLKNIADRMADCWWEFGEGQVDSVFKKNRLWENSDKCFVCFEFTVDDIKSLENVDMTKEDLFDFLISEPYIAKETQLPHCDIDDSGDCFDETTSECERKGGECILGAPSLNQFEYDKWACNKNNEKCFIKDRDMITYAEYIGSHKGSGSVIYDTKLEKFKPDTNYAITYISDTSAKNVADVLGLGGVGAAAGVIVAFIPGVNIAAAATVGISAAIGVVYGLVSGEVSDKIYNSEFDAILISDTLEIEKYCKEQRGQD